jgi:hypothetical protein
MTLNLTASGTELWRKYNTDGVSGSGLHSPELNDIQRWAGEVEAIVDLGFGIAVVTRTLSTPPASPATGAIYIVGASPAGDWSTFAEDDLAQWSGSAWSNRTPDVGNEVYVIDEGLRCTFSSAGWSNNAGVRKKNYILNGAMMVSQENGTTAGTVTGYYPVDQFSISFSNAGAVSVAQVASATPGGSPNRLRVTVTTADASVAAGDFCNIIQKIEGLRAADLRLGSSAAKTVTLRFGVKAPAGTYCIGLRNSASNRSYVAEFTIAAGEANTDVVKSVTVALDQSGTWLKDNGIGLEITFNLMVGSTYQTAAGVWTAGSFTASSNQFNFMGTLSNVFELFDVGLYDGASPEFQVPDYPAELLACARYFYATSAGTRLVSMQTDNVCIPIAKPAQQRIAPTLTHLLTNASFTSGGSPTSAQWGLQAPQVASATKTGTAAFTTYSSAEPGGDLIIVYTATFNRACTAIIIGSDLAKVTLNARM